MHSDIVHPAEIIEQSEMDKYETNQGFGDIVQQQNRANNQAAIKVKQYIPRNMCRDE